MSSEWSTEHWTSNIVKLLIFYFFSFTFVRAENSVWKRSRLIDTTGYSQAKKDPMTAMCYYFRFKWQKFDIYRLSEKMTISFQLTFVMWFRWSKWIGKKKWNFSQQKISADDVHWSFHSTQQKLCAHAHQRIWIDWFEGCLKTVLFRKMLRICWQWLWLSIRFSFPFHKYINICLVLNPREKMRQIPPNTNIAPSDNNTRKQNNFITHLQ